MAYSEKERFTTITVEGALFPSEMIRRIAAADPDIDGLKPSHYNLPQGERINEAISRAWNRLFGLWNSFKLKREKELHPNDSGTGLTREQWLLPLFQELGYGRLQRNEPFIIQDKSYPISHAWNAVPIHLTGCGVSLDRKKKGEPGASESSPHSLMQEFLNRSEDHLWGIVSNGITLRLLRDNVSLTRRAYIQFDIEEMMNGEVYSDFALLWLLCHQSRVEAPDQKNQECWLEKWHKLAITSGIRIMENLRSGVENAIIILGRGFLNHKSNSHLIEALQTRQLSPMDYYNELLRLVYRIIFLLVAESRNLLLIPNVSREIKERYYAHYSITRLRRLAARPKRTQHTDMWQALRLVFQFLGSQQGCPQLGLPPLGTFLWSHQTLPFTNQCLISNRDLLYALHSLCFVQDNKVTHPVDYKNIGPEELGSVYESLLEFHPIVNPNSGVFELKTTGGSDRKTTGSYYTPTPLIVSLLDTALEPLLKERKTQEEILSIKVCDPACGSGHFLLAAANRIARRLASIRTQESEPPLPEFQKAMRDVIGRCIYGVDLNPMAVELCKVGLWMEAIEPGKPLSFLDHHIRCGNSLIGAYPALIKNGIPDEAFEYIEGDDKAICKKYKSLNKKARGTHGLRSLYDTTGEQWFGNTKLNPVFKDLDSMDDSTIQAVLEKEQAYHAITRSDDYLFNTFVAHAWCAAFMWKKIETTRDNILQYPIHYEVFMNITRNPEAVPQWMKDEVQRLALQYGFFHFHLAFPQVFQIPQEGEATENPLTGWNGGFDVVLGNPPWERVKLQEKEWFEVNSPDIAQAATAAIRSKMIAQMETDDPVRFMQFKDALREAAGESHFIRNSLKFPLCGRGDINTYMVFTETNRDIINLTGRVGCIVPSGIATDDTTKFFFQDLVQTRTLASLYDFENKNGLFPGVHRSFKFCLLTLTGKGNPITQNAEFIFFAQDTADLKDEERRFTLTPDEIELVNPNTKTCPIFRFKHDAELVKQIYKNIPILIAEEKKDGNIWDISFLRMMDMANDSQFFKTIEELEAEMFELKGNRFVKESNIYYPLYEAKMIHQYNHRFGDYRDHPLDNKGNNLPEVPVERLVNPEYVVFPRYWVHERLINEKLKKIDSQINWLMGWRDITNNTNERTFISSVIPVNAVGDKILLFFPKIKNLKPVLVSNLNSFISDFITRQKFGGLSLKYYILKQLPVLPPEAYEKICPWEPTKRLKEWIMPRVLELVYTAWDLQDFARDCGYDGPPFIWDEERRFLLRCELDAAFFHLYQIAEPDVDYIMETFPIVKKKDIARYGSYRTKEKILEIYRNFNS